jgi:hypothetical protein
MALAEEDCTSDGVMLRGGAPCANIEILPPCELQVFESHDMGRGDLVRNQVEGGAGFVQGLLEHIALRHTLRSGSPLMEEPGQRVIVRYPAQKQESVCEPVTELLADPLGLS